MIKGCVGAKLKNALTNEVIICDYDVCHQSFADRHSFRSHVFTVSLTVAFWKSTGFQNCWNIKAYASISLTDVWSFSCVYILSSVILVIFLPSDSNLLHYVNQKYLNKLTSQAKQGSIPHFFSFKFILFLLLLFVLLFLLLHFLGIFSKDLRKV